MVSAHLAGARTADMCNPSTTRQPGPGFAGDTATREGRGHVRQMELGPAPPRRRSTQPPIISSPPRIPANLRRKMDAEQWIISSIWKHTRPLSCFRCAIVSPAELF